MDSFPECAWTASLRLVSETQTTPERSDNVENELSKPMERRINEGSKTVS
jgi:hypothetical protein